MALKKIQEDEFFENLRLGMPLRHAAQAVLVTEQAIYYKMNRSPEFKAKVEAAQTHAVKASLAVVRQAALGRKAGDGVDEMKPQWQAAAWFLERRHRDDFALKTFVEGDINVNDRLIVQAPDKKPT